MENCWKWSGDELIAWAGVGRLTEWLAPRVHAAVPRAGAMSSEAWSGLEIILNAAGPFKDRLIRLFAATALLSPPLDVHWTSLQAYLTGVPLTTWRHGNWRLVSVPCLGHTPTMITLMCGHSTEKLPGIETENLSPETKEAIGIAASLAVRKWGGHFVCWHWSGKTGISGASLGLPVYLGFGCAAEGLPVPRAMATGKLDPSGAIEPVENVERKASLAGDRSFFIPEANFSRNLNPCIPVGHIDDAWELWKSCGTAKSPDHLRTLLHCLDEPERLFPFLLCCTEAEVSFLDTDVHIQRIKAALKKTPLPVVELRALLVELATSREERHRKALNLILKIFPENNLHRVAESAPAFAWRLAMLHLRAFNHTGHPKEAAQLRETARQWENELDSSDSEEELIAHSLAIVGLLHNTYRFREDPWKALGPCLSDLVLQAERRVAQGRKRNKPLGDWYGTLAQHYAFRGELREAENYLEKAIVCFAGRPEDRLQSISYRFFARLDAGKPEALDDLLTVLGIERLDSGLSSHIQLIDDVYARTWSLFALARYAVDTRIVEPALQITLAEVAEALANDDRIWGMTPERHPWQLILFNLGFLAETDAEKERLWRKSLELCLHEKSGPAIRVMALLPLSAMQDQLPALPGETEAIIAGIIHMIREVLDDAHFARVLSAPDWTEKLKAVTAYRAKLFPFNYR